jgi:hypothetical protein
MEKMDLKNTFMGSVRARILTFLIKVLVEINKVSLTLNNKIYCNPKIAE